MMDDKKLQHITRLARTFFETEQIPGGALVIVHEGQTVLAEGFGLRDVARNAPVTADTIFGIASLTKSFTSLALLLLEAQGQLSLDDDVRRYLPDFQYPGLDDDVTLRHLASHTSGMPSLPGLSYALRPSQKGDPGERFLRTYPEALPPLTTYPELLAFLASRSEPCIAKPGTYMSYNNDGYALLGAVIEVVSGLTYEEFVTQRILTLLGMTRSTFDVTTAQQSGNVTTLYAQDPQGNVFASPQWEEAPAHLATGFLKSTSRDLGRYLQYLLTPQATPLAHTDLVQQLTQPLAWCGPNTHYGMGLMIQTNYQGVTLIRHAGGLKGVSSYLGFVPEQKLGIAVLSNVEDKPVSRLWRMTLNNVLGLKETTPFYQPAKNDAPVTLKHKLAGYYASAEPWGKLDVTLNNHELYARYGETLSEPKKMHLTTTGVFYIQDGADYQVGRIILNNQGHTTGVQLGSRYLPKQAD